jgi:ABC-type multidrug transport system, ATPase component
MENLAIEVQNLSKKMKENEALRGISLNFKPHIMHGVIGPEGAGKTTLLRTLLGLLKPDQGEVKFFNETQTLNFADLRPHIAYMPQTQSLYPDLSIDEHLDFFRHLYDLPLDVFNERKERLLKITRLEEFTDRLASKLSGGMYKKLGLICSLLHEPKLLLLDEPTNGVDPISRRDFWDLLYHLEDQGMLIIVTTAYMDEAERCKEVHLLSEGECIGEGEPLDLLNQKHCRTFDELFLKMGGHNEGR